MSQKVAPHPPVAQEVTALFRTKRVSEIRVIEGRVRAEAEDKAEALRDLLGTRYKDLLGAADVISSTRDASQKRVTDALSELARSSTGLREHFLQRSARGPALNSPKTGADGEADGDGLAARRATAAVGARLKHLVDSGELLYGHLEAGALGPAAARFAAARAHYATLKSSDGEVAARFAALQWSQVASFRPQIEDAARARLGQADLSYADYSSPFAALLVLAGADADAPGVLRLFLAARLAAVRSQLAGGKEMESGKRFPRVAGTVKRALAAVAAMLGPDEGLVFPAVRDADASAAEAVEKQTSPDALREVCRPWLVEVQKALEKEGRQLLAQVETPRKLAAALSDVGSVLNDADWSSACEIVLGERGEAVFAVFKPVISARANVVAQKSVDGAADAIVSAVDEAWGAVKRPTNAGKEVWNSIAAHSVHRPGEGNTTEASALVLAGPVSDVSAALDETLGRALEDARAIADHIADVPATVAAAAAAALPGVAAALQTRVDSVASSVDDNELTADRREQNGERALFAARVAGTLGASTHIENAFMFASRAGGNADGAGGEKQLAQFCKRLDEVAASAHAVWAAGVCDSLRARLRNDLDTNLAREAPAAWTQSAAADTEADGGEAIGSGVKCPRTASTAAVRFAVGACAAANAAGGLVLPRAGLVALTGDMVSAVRSAYAESVSFYKKSADEGELDPAAVDTAFMQMLFDLRFFTAVLPGATKKTFASISGELRGGIDPIDLASSADLMGSAVEDYAARTSVLFGVFGSLKDAASKQPTAAPYMASSGFEFANLVPIADTVPRFAYLPAPMPSTYAAGGTSAAGLSARAAVEQLRHETKIRSPGVKKTTVEEASVVDYASKAAESVVGLGSRFCRLRGRGCRAREVVGGCLRVSDCMRRTRKVFNSAFDTFGRVSTPFRPVRFRLGFDSLSVRFRFGFDPLSVRFRFAFGSTELRFASPCNSINYSLKLI